MSGSQTNPPSDPSKNFQQHQMDKNDSFESVKILASNSHGSYGLGPLLTPVSTQSANSPASQDSL
ncbi:MAG: hypothetical protein EZS28_033812, partial [Streblomastix strix]